MVFAVSEGDVLGWLSPAVVVALLLAVSATVAFASVESRHPDPLIRVNPAAAAQPARRQHVYRLGQLAGRFVDAGKAGMDRSLPGPDGG